MKIWIASLLLDSNHSYLDHGQFGLWDGYGYGYTDRHFGRYMLLRG